MQKLSQADLWPLAIYESVRDQFRRGESEYLTDHVENLTGHPACSVTDYLHSQADLFATT